MLTLTKGRNGKLNVKCDFYYRQRMNSIYGAKWNPNLRCWDLPNESLPLLEMYFKGEIYYKTPRWKLIGATEPPKQEIAFFQEPVIVPEMEIKPYNYQEFGIQFIVDRLNNIGFALLGDDVGLGKTPQTIGAIKWFVENKKARRILIICKKSIKTQWAKEIREFTGWNAVPIISTKSEKKKRLKAYEDFSKLPAGILVTSFHNFLNDVELIRALDFDLCVVDEAHCVKNAVDGKMNKNISSVVNGKKCILLTGTPIMSKPDDIYGIIKLATPDYFGTYEEYSQRYLTINYGIYGRQIVGAKHLDELQEKISSILLRRTAEEVDKDLPEFLPPRTIIADKTKLQDKMLTIIKNEKAKLDEEKDLILKTKEFYPDYEQQIEELNNKGKGFIAIEQLITDDPNVLKYLKTDFGINKRLLKELPEKNMMSPKTEATIDKIKEIVDAGGKVIVFTHYYSPAKMLEEEIRKQLKYNVVMFTGKQSEEERDRNIELFKNDDEYNVLIGNEACAEGLNLQVAQYLINYEQADTYAQRTQRLGRIRRVGSKFEKLIVYDIITENSFDESRLNKMIRNKELSAALLN